MFKNILVPTDGSALSNKAITVATALAKIHKAKLTAIHVSAPYSPPSGDGIIYYPESFSPQEYRKAMEAKAQKALGKVVAAAAAAKVPCATISTFDDQPWAAIIAAAKKKRCDLIVMASHGRRGLTGLLLGSETNKVLTHSRTPVLVCR
jgi:nucleotide-binding universal stress UspA family protein